MSSENKEPKETEINENLHSGLAYFSPIFTYVAWQAGKSSKLVRFHVFQSLLVFLFYIFATISSNVLIYLGTNELYFEILPEAYVIKLILAVAHVFFGFLPLITIITNFVLMASAFWGKKIELPYIARYAHKLASRYSQ
jgi:uncharacterized membrane protein